MRQFRRIQLPRPLTRRDSHVGVSAHAGKIVNATYGPPDPGSLWRQMAKLRTTISRVPYAPRA
jgi:hypothetical protein